MVLSSQGPRVREEEEQQSIYRKWRRNRWTVHNCGGKLTRKENRKRELANPLQLQATKRTLKWTNKYLREGRIPPFRTFLMFSGSWKRKVKRSPNGQVGVSVLGPRTKAGMRIFPCRNQRRNNWRGKKKKCWKLSTFLVQLSPEKCVRPQPSWTGSNTTGSDGSWKKDGLSEADVTISTSWLILGEWEGKWMKCI